MGTPTHALAGTSVAPADLIVGVYEHAIRAVHTLSNATSADIKYAKGRLFTLAPDGSIAAMATTDFTPTEETVLIGGDVTKVENEAVGTGNGTLTSFTLDHAPVVDGSLALKVNDVATTTGFSIDLHRGIINFEAGVTDQHAIVATYEYQDAPTEKKIVVPPLYGYVPLVLENAVTVPKKVESTNGSVTANFVLKGEVAKDLLLVGAEEWDDLEGAEQTALYNILVTAGLIPTYVMR